MSNTPIFVYRSGVIADKSYVEWLSEVKRRIQRSQIKAAIRVNSAMLEFYWSLGRDIILMKAENKWGTGFFNQLSLDLKDLFPNQTGFSVTNLKYMKRWYAFYSEQTTNRQRPIDGLDNAEIRQRLVDELEMPEIFGQVPWGQHIDIISKCEKLEEAMFYIHQTIEHGWSRPQLNDGLDAKIFKTRETVVTNFDKTLPLPQNVLAQEILKSPYNFDFLTMRKGYDEKELEEALVKNVTQFLLELGKGFAYVGRQMELRMDEETAFFPDLVFYHIPQKRYVIIELKAVKFAPEFAGKLNFYVTAADKLLRGADDNPSVGLIICRTAKKTIVEWSLQDINKPLGVATYQLQEVVDRTVIEIEQKQKE
ncbi:MAG: DUF1016 family protein [Prevotella sp.]|nr:DUF1016 family protein [Prevotella sp.]